MIINAFKNKLFPLYSGNYYEEFKEESSESEGENEEPEDKMPDINTSEQINMLDKFYGSDSINEYFKEKSLAEIINQLNNCRENPETQQEYNNLMVHLIIGLRKLDSGIRNLFKKDVKNKRLDYLKDLVRSIVDANQNLDDMPPLESEEDAAERQRGQGLKILTRQQMITRLPIL